MSNSNIQTNYFSELLNKINIISDDDFINWYCTIFTNSLGILDISFLVNNNILEQLVLDDNLNRYYKLFTYLQKFLSYQEELTENKEASELTNLLDIISKDKSFYVNRTKKELIEKITDLMKLYKITFEIENWNDKDCSSPITSVPELQKYSIVVQELDANATKRNCYDPDTNTYYDLINTKLKYKIVKVLKLHNNNFTNVIFENQVLTLNKNETGELFRLEFTNPIKFNYNFLNAKISLEKFT